MVAVQATSTQVFFRRVTAEEKANLTLLRFSPAAASKHAQIKTNA